jgi:hypothetical protein
MQKMGIVFIFERQADKTTTTMMMDDAIHHDRRRSLRFSPPGLPYYSSGFVSSDVIQANYSASIPISNLRANLHRLDVIWKGRK